MNILVLGGLFLLGMVAVVAAILLVMSERGNEHDAALPAAAPTAAMPAPSVPAPSPAAAGVARPTRRLTVPLQAAETGHTKAPQPVSQSLPTMPGGDFAPAAGAAHYSTGLNGQVRELAAELRALHVRAGEVERRLSVLVEMVEHIEHDYGGLVDVDLDEAEVSPDVPPGR